MRDRKTGKAVDPGKRLGRRQACALLAGRWHGGWCRMPAPGLTLQAPPRVGSRSVSGSATYRSDHLYDMPGTRPRWHCFRLADKPGAYDSFYTLPLISARVPRAE